VCCEEGETAKGEEGVRDGGRRTYSAIRSLATLIAIGVIELKIGRRAVGNTGLNTDDRLGVDGVLPLERGPKRNNVAAAVADKERSSLTQGLVGTLGGITSLNEVEASLEVDAYVLSGGGVLADHVLTVLAFKHAVLLRWKVSQAVLHKSAEGRGSTYHTVIIALARQAHRLGESAATGQWRGG
jgi:hypothetical protein